MKNCDHSNFIFQTSLNTLKANRNLFTDYYADWSKGKPQKQGQIKGFIENRHDQSIFSVVCKKYGAEFLQGNELDGDDDKGFETGALFGLAELENEMCCFHTGFIFM